MNYPLEARKALKMTQAQFAIELGLSQPSVSRIENNPEELTNRDRLAIRGLLAEKRVRLKTESP